MLGGLDLRYWAKVATFVAIVACLLFSLPHVSGVSAQDAVTAIAAADHALQAAFVSVSDTERAGANVSGLIARLNEAGSVLTSARAASDAGNYSDAASLAAFSDGLADGVVADAGVLKKNAVDQAAGWWMTVLFSVAGCAVFVTVLFLVWRWFERFHANRLSGRRPEVVG